MIKNNDRKETIMGQQIKELLNDVGFRLATLKEARNRFSDQLAPEFRIFDYLRTDEMGLSTCIASLLDPNGKHGQGSVFLNAFLKNIGVEEEWTVNSKNCRVSTEKQVNGQRRIDIFLELPSGVIGIENKPWAGCQDNQLADYADYIEKFSGGKNWLLVFLSNRDPEEKSLSQKRREELMNDGRFVQRSYMEIIDWLDLCAYKTRASVVRVFIEELTKFIRTNINGEVEMSDEKEIISAVLKTPETLGSAFQIIKTINSIKKDLLEKFYGDLDSGLKKENLILSDWGMQSWQASTGFNVQFDNNAQKLYLRFEFEKTGLNGFFWGIRRKNKKYSNAPVWGEVNKLMTAEFYPGRSSQWWPWYLDSPNHEFDVGMKDWSISEKPWVMIMNGEMAPKIVELAVRVNKAFSRNDQLHLLCEEELVNSIEPD
jgi:hypothetical protein